MSNEPRTVKVIKAQVYSRVVGYYTTVDGWNKGKKEEFSQRHTMTPQELGIPSPITEISPPICRDGICKVG